MYMTYSKEKSVFCPNCGRLTLHKGNNAGEAALTLGILMTVMSCGLLIPIAILLVAVTRTQYICQTCGKTN